MELGWAGGRWGVRSVYVGWWLLFFMFGNPLSSLETTNYIPHPHKASDLRVVFQGVVYEFSEPEEQQVYTTPRIAMATFNMVCGAGAQIVGVRFSLSAHTP